MKKFRNNLIVLEGIDGSGKHTQAVLLANRLRDEFAIPVRELSYPCYGTDCCKPVELYLNGAFGSHAGDTGPYTASVFYAVDRYGDFRLNWAEAYNSGDLILTDRYTTSNLTCQSGKLSGIEREKYLDWVQDFEYRIMGLPRPGLVIYLDVTAEISHEAMLCREKLDVHENDISFMRHFRESGLAVAEQYHWHILDCCDQANYKMRDMQSINDDLLEIVLRYLRENQV